MLADLTSVTDTYGRSLTFAYNASGHVVSVTGADLRGTTFQYDSTGHLPTTIADPVGNTIKYSYNALFQITSKIDKAVSSYLPVIG